MIDEYTDKLPMIPATSVQEIKNRLLPFVEASVDRLIVPYVVGHRASVIGVRHNTLINLAE